jgi:hypothetical protein
LIFIEFNLNCGYDVDGVWWRNLFFLIKKPELNQLSEMCNDISMCMVI